VEGGETNAEEIGSKNKTHTKQTEKEQGKNQNQKQGEQTKTKNNGKQSKNNEIKHQMINQRGSDKIWPKALLRKVAMGERRGGDAQMTCHRRRATKTPRSRRPKQGKNRQQEKRKGEERRKRKGGTPGLGHQVNN
jgi:hypothetical protein